MKFTRYQFVIVLNVEKYPGSSLKPLTGFFTEVKYLIFYQPYAEAFFDDVMAFGQQGQWIYQPVVSSPG